MNSLSLKERIAKLAGQMRLGQEAEAFTGGIVRQAAKFVAE